MSDKPLDTGNRDRLKQLLSEALELDGDERVEFLAGLRSEHPELATRLAELAQAWDRATTMLRVDQTRNTAPPLEFTDQPMQDDDLLGKRFGRYRFDAVVGSGGFGVVYRGRQESPVVREVAIKVARHGVVGGEFLARFEAERHALARLTHPAIARLYDADALPDGRPFFAMELVEGTTLTAYCDENNLTLEQRIELFRDVCAAVQHAHQKGVIHRDLKPSNILVGSSDEGPFVKVIDFGIAKAIDEPFLNESVVTLAQQIIGTPQYMPPEQASGGRDAVDTRSDVFSLGVVFYELLCGARPIADDVFRATTPAELGRMLSTMPAPRPSARFVQLEGSREDIAQQRGSDPDRLPQSLAGELDWIAARAIEPQPDRRYPSPAAMSDDLKRYLTNVPVEARPPSRAYLVRKFARRHRTAVGAAAALALMLTVLLAVLATSLAVVRSERNAAVASQQESERLLAFFLEVFSSARGDRLGRDVTVLEAVESGLEWADERFADDPMVAAAVHQAAGNLFHTQGRVDRAIEQLDIAADLADSAGQRASMAGILIRNDRAILLGDLNRHEEMVRELELLHTEAMDGLGSRHPATLLVKANYAGQVLVERQDPNAAEALRFVVAQGPEPNMEAYVTALLAISQVQEGLGPGEAENALRRVLDVTDETPERWLRQRLGAQNNLAARLHAAGQSEEALGLFVQIRDTLRERFGPDSSNLIVTMNNIASAQERLGRLDAALLTRDEVEALAARTLPPGHPSSARLLSGRADLLIRLNRLADAEAALLQARAILESAVGVPAVLLTENAQTLERVCRLLDRPADADRWAGLADADPSR